MIDLHTHSKYSDGIFRPAEVLRLAKERGITTIALVDHDITDGLPEAMATGENFGIQVIPGVELSINENGAPCHILGFKINAQNQHLQDALGFLKEKRRERAKEIVKKLKTLGFQIEFEDLEKNSIGVMGKPHIASAILEKKENQAILQQFEKEAGTLRNALFKRFLNPDQPAFVEDNWKLSLESAINLIHQAGGLAFLAHPGSNLKSSYPPVPDWLIQKAIQLGLDGIEAYHHDNSPEQIQKFLKLARQNNLLISAGSDFHGYDAFNHLGYVDIEQTRPITEDLIGKVWFS